MSTERQVLSKERLGISEGIPLQVSGESLSDLRNDIQRLMDIEAIRQLKYAYFRCIDTANLDELGTLFHEDVLVHFVGGTYEWKLQGRKEYLDNIGVSFSNRSVGHHNGHHPEIQMLSSIEATGIWYLADNMWILNHNAFTTGTAIYWDKYEKVEGRWLISETRYERLYEINRVLEENPQLSSHYLGAYGPEPQF